MAYRLLPGFRTDHRGRLYQAAVYPNGKGIAVPVKMDENAEKGYVIPTPVEQPKIRRTLKLSVQEQKRRLMVVEFRRSCEKEIERLNYDSVSNGQAFVDIVLRPLMRSPDQGATWIAVENSISDYHNIWHKEAE